MASVSLGGSSAELLISISSQKCTAESMTEFAQGIARTYSPCVLPCPKWVSITQCLVCL